MLKNKRQSQNQSILEYITRPLVPFMAFNRNLINKDILTKVTWRRSEERGGRTDTFIKSPIDARAPQRPTNWNKRTE